MDYDLHMLFGRHGTFTGGIDLPDEKSQTLALAVRPWARSDRLCVPLAPCGGAPALPVIEPNARVSAGQRIAEAADSGGVDVFAPLSARVAGSATVDLPGRDGFFASPAVELTDLDGRAEIDPSEPVFAWEPIGAEALRERISQGHLTTSGRPAEPLARWLARARQNRCRLLIANVMEGQPGVTADHRLLVDYGPEVVVGLAILARAIEAETIMLAADRRRTDDYGLAIGPARRHNVQRVALAHKYPTGAEAVLVGILTRRQVPPGGTGMDVGAAVIDAATCFAVYRWVACGHRATGRVVTVAGRQVARPGNFFVPFGTRCLALTDPAAGPILHGGPMVGLRCTAEAVVAPGSDAVLAVDLADPAPPAPCIRCGWCTDHCPAGLNVVALNDLFELADLQRAGALGVMACVECGVCTYLCPARLPLAQRVRQLKRAIAAGEPVGCGEAGP